METVLRTQADTDAFLTAHIRIGECIPVTFEPMEPINLTQWIGAHECCSFCGEATPGLRLDSDGHLEEECAQCGETGFLITCWGTAQTERWERGERYAGPGGDTIEDGPQVGPIVVLGGVPEHVAALLAQAEAAWVVFEDRVLDALGSGGVYITGAPPELGNEFYGIKGRVVS